MTYPSEISKKTKEENKQKMFNELALLYLNSNTIDEYKIARNLKYPNLSNFFDKFLWWYFYKENEKIITYCALTLFILSFISGILLMIFASWLLILIPIFICFLTVAIIKFYAIFIEKIARQDVILNELVSGTFGYYDKNGI